MIATIFMTFGCLFFLISAVGVLKFQDLYSRMHAATKSSSLGMGLMLVSIMIHFGSWVVVFKCLLIIFFTFLTAPIAAHILGRAGYLSGAKPWEGTRIDELQDLYK